MIKHNLYSIRDTDKQTLIELYEILIVKNLKEVHRIF